MKRIVKAILRKMLRPVLSRYHLMMNKLDKYPISILSVLSISAPITEYPPARGTLRKIQLAKTNVLFAFDRFCKEKNCGIGFMGELFLERSGMAGLFPGTMI
ncbi:MAG: hypothetical protein LBU18_02580 [Treponema sp.]|nr:hypothetical protein [Treponema sp.]